MNNIVNVTRESIVEQLPIGTLVFAVKDSKIEIITVNDRLLLFANMVHEYVDTSQQTKWNKEALIRVFSQNIYAFAVDEDMQKVKDLVKEAGDTGFSQKVFRLRGTFGENTKWISASCSAKKMDEHICIYYTIFIDCTSQVLYEKKLLDKQKELEDISQYDTLTNVFNRYSYNVYLEKSKTSLKKETGIVFADMNGLKAANDEFGHLFGDGLITGFTEVLLKYFSREEIFRISGDEFVVVAENISVIDFENKMKALEEELKENNMAAIGYKWESIVVDLKHSIYQTEQLMMIQKQKYYIDNRSVESKHRPKILKTLLTELSQGQYMVYLQPKAVMGSRRVTGAEALIRKRSKDGMVIPPYEFVPIFEKELLISKIDFFVLEEVCKLLQRWKKEGRRLIKISVNMSRVSMAETDFLEHLVKICDAYDVEHGYIEIEITESTDTKDNRKMTEIVSTLAELGFGVSLDDMGNDYSSIKMITMKGIDTIKIDRGLVLQLHDNEGLALIRYIVALCHEIGKKCIAEGVEEKAQEELLAGIGCDYYQGFILDKPIPIEAFETYLSE